MPIFEALSQIRVNRVFSPIRIEIRVIRVQSSLLSIFWKVDSPKKAFAENREISTATTTTTQRARKENLRRGALAPSTLTVDMDMLEKLAKPYLP